MQFIHKNLFLRAYDTQFWSAYNTHFMVCNTHVPHTNNPTQGVYSSL